jgi:hypothetical protein
MNPDPPPFTVSLVGKAVEQFRQVAARARRLDLTGALAIVYRHIFEALETRPREWGDPFYNYRGLDATSYRRAILPAGLVVEYAAHNTDRVVWVSKLIVLEDSPFASG